MKNAPLVVFTLLISCFWSCKNEVELNADFEEVTVIYGLLDQNVDTQFVKINKSFLDKEKSLLQLADEADRLFYDSLTVTLIEEKSGNTSQLLPINRPKEPGTFTTEKNIVYYTTQQIKSNTNYRLEVKKPDETVAIGKTNTVDTIYIKKPNIGLARVNSVSFVDRNQKIKRYPFLFETGKNVAEFEVNLYFKYTEIIGVDSFPRQVKLPLTKQKNQSAEEGKEFLFNFNGEQFFRAIEEQVPASVNPTKKVIFPENNFDIEVFVADVDYSFYRELNGPLDGLAQTRPEYSNITNGYGVFASRLSRIAKSQINDDTRIYLVGEYKDTRNFSYP